MEKKGISAIVATVLVISITVAGIGIIWVGIVPMISESIAFSELDGRVSVVSTGGYTVYDAAREVAIVQVKRDVDDGVMDRIKVSFVIDGNSVSSNVVAPGSGGLKTYNFDLGGLGVPESVGVAPIFVSGSGSEKEGSSSSIGIRSGRIENVRGVVYGIGVDAFAEVPTDGLVSIWSFSGDVLDGWGDNDGVLMNGEDDELVNGELVLDGIDDYVYFATTTGLDMTDSITLSAWVNTNDPYPATHGFIFQGDNGNSYLSMISNIFLFTLSIDSTREDLGTSGFPFSINNWHHVVGTWDGSMERLYKDGVEIVSEEASGELSFTASGQLYIGRYMANLYHFDGSMDNLMIYDRALSTEEVVAVYDVQKKD